MGTLRRALLVCGALALSTCLLGLLGLLGCETTYFEGYATPDLSSPLEPDLAAPVDLGIQADQSPGDAPTIITISPPSGSNAGGTQLTITGTGFLAGARVTVGGTACGGVTVVDDTSITCTTPAKAATCGAVAVVVTNPDNQSAMSNEFSYAPRIFALASGSNIVNGAGSRSAVVADFNGDGKNDVANLTAAVAGRSSVSVQLGNGNGTFAATKNTTLALGLDPAAMALGDLDDNGAADVVVVLNAGSTTPQVLVMLGQKDGTFKAHASGPIALTRSSAPTAVAVATADSKAKPYIVISGTTSQRATIDVLRNDGTGALSGLTQTIVGGAQSGASHVALADLDGDGKLDAVTANSTGNSVSVLAGNGAGTFTAVAGSPFAMGSVPNHVIAVDLDNDGNLDLVTANTGSGLASAGINVRKGDGALGFGNAPIFTLLAVAPTNLVSADLNGDYAAADTSRPQATASDMDENLPACRRRKQGAALLFRRHAAVAPAPLLGLGSRLGL